MTADLRALLGRTALAEATDGELLVRYSAERDDVAFAELVHRHAPAVYAACRRFLSAPADLDDAFQATFVLLSRKAGSLAHPDRLCGWLCGAAGRIARKVRDRSSKRSATETRLDDRHIVTPTPPDSADLKAVLDDELTNLPPAYREAVVLCDVEGVSRRTAAKRLGIPESTLSNRLTRARAMLGTRLLRRGVALGAGLSLSAVATASVPAKLVPLTVSRITSGVTPPHVASLANEGLEMPLPLRAAVAVLIGLCVAGLSLVTLTAAEPPKTPSVVSKPADPPEPDDPTPIDGGIAFGATYSRDGRLLAIAEVIGGVKKDVYRVTVFDATTWKVLHHLTGPTGIPRAVAFTADGRTVFASGDDGVVYSWDVKTGEAGVKLDAKAGACGAVVLSPDGKLLASAHQHFKNKQVKPRLVLWDVATGKVVHSLENDEKLVNVTAAFSPDGKRLLGAYGAALNQSEKFHGLVEWDVETGKEANRIDTPRVTKGATPIVQRVAYTADGTRVVAAGGEAVPMDGGGCNCLGYLWLIDRKTGKVEKTLIENDSVDYVRQMALSADGKKMYVGRAVPWAVFVMGKPHTTTGAEVQCWDTTRWEVEWAQAGDFTHRAWAFAAAPDGKRVAVSSENGVDLRDPATGAKRGALTAPAPPK
jgi:RNA polymerase sigma factor (sigma-70 family)